MQEQLKTAENESWSRIDRVFDWAKQKGVTWQEGKERNADSTYKTYADVMKAFEKHLQNEYGLKDITRAKPRHALEFIEKKIEAYKSTGEGSPLTMRQFPHALHALQSCARESGAFRGLSLGRKDRLVNLLDVNNVYRYSSESKCLKATHEDYEKVQAEVLKSKSPNGGIVAQIHQVQRHVGCRISETMNLKKEHITFQRDGTATVFIKGKGGHTRWVSVTDKGTVGLLREESFGKKPGAFVFQIKNRAGKDKTHKGAEKICKDVVRSAAVRAGVNRNRVTYSTHSARKAFAQEHVNKYAKKTLQELEKELKRREKNYPLDKNGKNKLTQKIREQLTELRKKIDPKGKRYSKSVRDAKRRARTWTHKELCLFLVSIDLGHFRLNVMRFYADYPKK